MLGKEIHECVTRSDNHENLVLVGQIIDQGMQVRFTHLGCFIEGVETFALRRRIRKSRKRVCLRDETRSKLDEEDHPEVG